MNISSDAEFPPYWGQEVADTLNSKRNSQAKMRIIDSPWGTLAVSKKGPFSDSRLPNSSLTCFDFSKKGAIRSQEGKRKERE